MADEHPEGLLFRRSRLGEYIDGLSRWVIYQQVSARNPSAYGINWIVRVVCGKWR
jgi:hypothetical protein